MQHAYTHIMENMSMLKPGVRTRDLSLNAHKLEDQYKNGKYGCLTHGVGLCDEWPLIAYPDKLAEGAFHYLIQAGMVLCVEALLSPEGGDCSIKMEDQVLETEKGYENLSKYPFDERLMGKM